MIVPIEKKINFERVNFLFPLRILQDCVEIKMYFGKNRLSFGVTNERFDHVLAVLYFNWYFVCSDCFC